MDDDRGTNTNDSKWVEEVLRRQADSPADAGHPVQNRRCVLPKNIRTINSFKNNSAPNK